MADELPPLPERMTVLKGALKGDWFTADQMRAYAQEAARQEREACAKVCDHLWTVGGDAAHCADDIRSRSSTTGEK